MKNKLLSLLLTLFMLLTLSVNVFAVSSKVNNPNKKLEEEKLTMKENKDVPIKIRQKYEQLKVLENKIDIIRLSNKTKAYDLSIKIEAMNKNPENYDIAKKQAIYIQYNIAINELKKLVSFNEILQNEIDKSNNTKLTIDETIFFLDKEIENTSHRVKSLLNIEKELDKLLNLF
ncbi:hypothetical protein LGK95_20385 [Clostridium algoriphilum]|uniref:hypothetical protein n=1 Tax=Clostridium algoriphilum TaxID=198347 RepID=UPI001CF2D574|nr:hypothetical protein [Clostridium algoriphilum]MCB2295828.1 hypothetical protein [Clostridium algoriphilum]